MKRAILIILDGCGIGEAPDAAQYGDLGSNTLKNLSDAVGGINLPVLESLGLGNLVEMQGIQPVKSPLAKIAKGIEVSIGKDTVSGHFEIAGSVVTKPFATFPKGFSEDIINEFCEQNNLTGVLGNKTASGTEIIKELGEEHISTNKPIVYTSADSVFQIACHEETFGLQRLYQICENSRKLCDDLNIARIIARPFLGTKNKFYRTGNRKDYSIDPPGKTLMDALQLNNIKVVGLGKIPSIYNYKGFDEEIKTKSNADGMQKLLKVLEKRENAFYFINLIDFDMLYGHRRDPVGFSNALTEFDKQLKELLNIVTEDDLIILTADHGNDPTYKGSDHTREIVPILAYQKNIVGKNIGELKGFFNIAASIYYFLTNKKFIIGESFN